MSQKGGGEALAQSWSVLAVFNKEDQNPFVFLLHYLLPTLGKQGKFIFYL